MSLTSGTSSYKFINGKLYKVYFGGLKFLYTGSYNGYYYSNGVKYTGTHNGYYYKNGVKFTGTHDGYYYDHGSKYTGNHNGYYYKNGKKFTGTKDGYYYKDGKKYTGTSSGYFYKDGKIYTGSYNGYYYKNGKKFTGNKDGYYYKDGKKFTGTNWGYFYKNGKIYTGTYDGYYYKNGKKYTGTHNGCYYKNGTKYTGNHNGYYYRNGVKFTGNYNGYYYDHGKKYTGKYNGYYYKNGKKYTGAYDGYYYKNGKKYTGYLDNIYYVNGKYANGVYNNKYYMAGLAANGTYNGIKYKAGKICLLESYFKLSYTSYTYTNAEKKPTITIKASNKYINSSNYTKYYKNNINAGTASVVITGKNCCTGTVNIKYTIKPKALTQDMVSLKTSKFVYDGTQKKPAITVSFGSTKIPSTNYTYSYSNNINAGTATVTVKGKSNCTGTVTKNYSIDKVDISKATATLSNTVYKFDGTEKKPNVTVKLNKSVIPATQYTLQYTNNINSGTASVTITGINNYKGKITKTFSIYPAIKYNMINDANHSNTKTNYIIVIYNSSYKMGILKKDTSIKGYKFVGYTGISIGRPGKTMGAGDYKICHKEKSFRLDLTYKDTNNKDVRLRGKFWYASALKNPDNEHENYIHSTAYDYNESSPKTEIDNRLGYKITNGCTRVPLSTAKYIYNNCGEGTRVLIRNK